MNNFNLFYWLLGIVALGLTINNVRRIKGYNREREFANVYAKVLRQDEDAYEAICTYAENEKTPSLMNKALVIQAYEMLIKGLDPTAVIDSINFEPLFKDKGVFNAKVANRNSDIFVWIALVFAKARSLSMFDIIDKINEKMKPFDQYLDKQLEYHLYKGYASAIAERNDEDTAFLTKLLSGDYFGMVYEQRLIGLYKRIAACFLAYLGDPVDEFFEEDLHSFAETLVGKCLMTDLEIIEKYPPVSEKTETEVVKEIEEDKKEEE